MRYLVLCYALIAFCTEAIACSCAGGTVVEHYQNSDLVFHAKLSRVDLVPVPESLKGRAWFSQNVESDATVRRGKFELITLYKGVLNGLDVVYTHPAGATCGVPISRGDEFIFFADATGIVALCGGNFRKKDTDNWDAQIAELEKLRTTPPLIYTHAFSNRYGTFSQADPGLPPDTPVEPDIVVKSPLGASTARLTENGWKQDSLRKRIGNRFDRNAAWVECVPQPSRISQR